MISVAFGIYIANVSKKERTRASERGHTRPCPGAGKDWELAECGSSIESPSTRNPDELLRILFRAFKLRPESAYDHQGVMLIAHFASMVFEYTVNILS